MDDRYDPLTGRIRDRERYRRGRGMDEPNMNFPEMAVAKCLPARNREFARYASAARTEPARARGQAWPFHYQKQKGGVLKHFFEYTSIAPLK